MLGKNTNQLTSPASSEQYQGIRALGCLYGLQPDSDEYTPAPLAAPRTSLESMLYWAVLQESELPYWQSRSSYY